MLLIGDEGVHGPVADNDRQGQSQSGSQCREDQAFEQQLAQQAGAAGAERGAQRQFALTTQALHQLQVGDVDAGQRQHQQASAEHQPQHAAGRLVDEAIGQRCGAQFALIAGALQLGAESCAQRLEFGAKLLDADAGGQPRHHFDRPAIVDCHPPRQPHIAGHREVEALGHHADQRGGLAVELDTAAEHARVRRKVLAPDAMAEQRHGGRAGPVVLGAEGPTQHRLHAEQLEHGAIEGHAVVAGGQRAAARRQVGGQVGVGAHAVDAAQLRAQAQEVRALQVTQPVAAGPGVAHRHQPLGLREGQRFQHHAVDRVQREEHRAKAQAQQQQRQRGVARSLPQPAQRIAQFKVDHPGLSRVWCS